jgi:hypothetical protein
MEGDKETHQILEVSLTPDLRLDFPDSSTNNLFLLVAEDFSNLACDVMAKSHGVVVSGYRNNN